MDIAAVIFDWAGTTVDHGSMAPVGVFVEVFKRRGVQVTLAEAREPMGVHKREHFRRMSVMPNIARQWRENTGHECRSDEVDAMYQEGAVIQIECLPRYATPIPGVLDVVGRLRARGVKIGSCTGYNREMLDVLVQHAARQGYRPDAHVAASEVPEGRPSPFMAWEAAKRVGAWPASACVKVGDTLVDIEEGLNAGMWTIGVALTGNLMGLTAEQLGRLPPHQRNHQAAVARRVLKDAGAHHVVDSVADLMPVLENIERRMRYQRP